MEAVPILEKAAPAVRPTALSLMAVPAADARSLRGSAAGCGHAGRGVGGGGHGQPLAQASAGSKRLPGRGASRQHCTSRLIPLPPGSTPDAQLVVQLVDLVAHGGGRRAQRAHRRLCHVLGAHHHLLTVRMAWRERSQAVMASKRQQRQQQVMSAAAAILPTLVPLLHPASG